ncbi:MAG: glycoside hydrolase family 3 C-terminal domain-containing protein [Firmicutes bacterium]|nr:glycoside hydrolase family 3 C-terminal domain-containing protein [Bacillota bacterium]
MIGKLIAVAAALMIAFGIVGQVSAVRVASAEIQGIPSVVEPVPYNEDGFMDIMPLAAESKTEVPTGFPYGGGLTNGSMLSEAIEGEGLVLVKNEGNLLPLSKSYTPQVNVFGWSSVAWVPGGSGSGRVKAANGALTAEVGIVESLNQYGIQTNAALQTFYRSHAAGRPRINEGTLNSYDYQYSRIIEPAFSSYTDTLKDGAKAYSETAIVAISRWTGESNDCPKVQYKGTGNSRNVDDANRHYLEISKEEQDMLEWVGENFKNVIVLSNGTNAIQLDFVDTIPGIDACMVVGATGSRGATAIAKALYGEINPSGRLADVQPYDFRSNPSWQNTGHAEANGATKDVLPQSMGQHFYTSSSTTGLYPVNDQNGNFPDGARYQGVAYIDYVENIYVGYKWYETAFAENYYAGAELKNKAGAVIKNGYDAVVQYPFGYGMSYSDFQWEIYGSTIIRDGQPVTGTALQQNDKIKVDVLVANVGTKPGKDVVQVYVTPPYTKGTTQIEKAAVNLVGFAKTPVIPAGEDRIVSIEFDAYDMASFDMRGTGGYVLEAGSYIVKPLASSHDVDGWKDSAGRYKTGVAKNLTFTVGADIRYDKDPGNKRANAASVKNRFTGEAALYANGGDGVPVDGGTYENITYMSRANFAGTFPVFNPDPQSARAMKPEVSKYNRFDQALANDWRTRWDAAHPGAPSIVFGSGTAPSQTLATGNNALAKEIGLDYDDPKWDTLMAQVSYAQARDVCRKNSNTTPAIAALGKPANTGVDGPNMWGGFGGGGTTATGFPTATVLAQTYNVRLAFTFGLHLGSDASNNGEWYAPGVNIHRSPMGGRNYEYHSEDGFLSGVMAAYTIMGVSNQGKYCTMKHLALYDQEYNRDSLYTWVTEQALREIYLKPFRIAVQLGGCSSIMTAYNRIGAVWTGGSEALMQNVLRDEYGFRGSFVTDWVDRSGFMAVSHALRAGGTTTINGGTFGWFTWDSDTVKQNNNAERTMLYNAAKDAAYAWANAIARQAKWVASAEPLLKETVWTTGTEYETGIERPAIKEYTVRFITNSGTAVADIRQAEGFSVSQPVSTRENFTLEGWYTNAEFTGAKQAFPFTLTGDVTLYAKWTPKQTGGGGDKGKGGGKGCGCGTVSASDIFGGMTGGGALLLLAWGAAMLYKKRTAKKTGVK